VSGYLLDTNVALIALSFPERLTPNMRRILKGGLLFLSVISYWEVLLKSMKGRLDVGDPRIWWTEALDQLMATSLVVRPDHIAAIYTLESIHQDPFDRALVAQAIVEDLTLVTIDDEIKEYASERFQVLS